MSTKSCLAILFLFFSCVSRAQQKQVMVKKVTAAKSVANLHIGDKVPEIFIPKIINDKARSVNLSNFNDRLVILDFWSTNCSGCVAGLPKMMDLQQKFGNQIKVLPVTFEQEAMVKAFLPKNKLTKNLNVPSVVEDKILANYFKHLNIPHEIWINKGVVMAITFSDYVTETNIQQILDGKKVNWPVKNDLIQPLDFDKPLLEVDRKQYAEPQGPVKYAAIFGYREGANKSEDIMNVKPNSRMDIKPMMGSIKDSIRHTIRNYFINTMVINAYCYYWHEVRDPDFKKNLPYYPQSTSIILEVKNPKKYASFEESGEYLDEWHRNHSFCYESVAPDTGQTKQDLSRAAIADLDYLLGLHVRFEIRKIKCLVLVRTATEDKLISAGGARVEKVDDTGMKLINGTLASMVYKLNQFTGNPPVFDSTGYTGNVDMEIKMSSWRDIPAIRKSLQAYGLDFKEEERDMEVLVVTEKNK